jgi:hypothetical protein
MRGINFIARMWYYFRIGYSTYLTFLLGALNTLIVVWYLAAEQIPLVQSLFGHFVPFAVVTSLIGIPLSIAIGWGHLKGSPAYQSEADIGVEANPYYYKFPPGYTREVYGPVYLELLIELKRLLEKENLLNDDDRSRIQSLEGKLRLLNRGGMIGTPRRRI